MSKEPEEILDPEPHKPTVKDFKAVSAENDGLHGLIKRLRDRFPEVGTFLDTEERFEKEKAK